jgi:hypothetical protein
MYLERLRTEETRQAATKMRQSFSSLFIIQTPLFLYRLKCFKIGWSFPKNRPLSILLGESAACADQLLECDERALGRARLALGLLPVKCFRVPISYSTPWLGTIQAVGSSASDPGPEGLPSLVGALFADRFLLPKTAHRSFKNLWSGRSFQLPTEEFCLQCHRLSLTAAIMTRHTSGRPLPVS